MAGGDLRPERCAGRDQGGCGGDQAAAQPAAAVGRVDLERDLPAPGQAAAQHQQAAGDPVRPDVDPVALGPGHPGVLGRPRPRGSPGRGTGPRRRPGRTRRPGTPPGRPAPRRARPARRRPGRPARPGSGPPAARTASRPAAPSGPTRLDVRGDHVVGGEAEHGRHRSPGRPWQDGDRAVGRRGRPRRRRGEHVAKSTRVTQRPAYRSRRYPGGCRRPAAPGRLTRPALPRVNSRRSAPSRTVPRGGRFVHQTGAGPGRRRPPPPAMRTKLSPRPPQRVREDRAGHRWRRRSEAALAGEPTPGAARGHTKRGVQNDRVLAAALRPGRTGRRPTTTAAAASSTVSRRCLVDAGRRAHRARPVVGRTSTGRRPTQ